jgi:hypothetical protein
LKGFVAEDDRVIGLRGVRDDHRHSGSPNSRGKRVCSSVLVAERFRQMPIVPLLHHASVERADQPNSVLGLNRFDRFPFR